MSKATAQAAAPAFAPLEGSRFRFGGMMLLVAFLSGWVVMMLEMLSARLLAPTFGYSVYQWGALIGVVLASMSAGYYTGARLGDGKHALAILRAALAIAILWIAATPLFLESLLPAMRTMGPVMGCVAASAILVVVPTFCLSIDTPIVARLSAAYGIARTTGRLYAISTVGSILGTFFAAFYAIPEIGVAESYAIAVALLVAALGLVMVFARDYKFAAVLALLPALYFTAPAPERFPHTIVRTDTVYNRIMLDKTGDMLALYLNYRDGAQTIMRTNSTLTGSYYDVFALAPLLHGPGTRRIAFLGSAGGTALRQITAFWPRVKVVGVELDPEVAKISLSHFGLARERQIEIVVDDARRFIQRQKPGSYDVVAIDLYVTGHIPFHTTTREFFAEVARALSPKGIVMMNVLAINYEETLVGPLARTMAASFGAVHRMGAGNVIMIATKEKLSAAELRRRLEAAPEEGSVLLRQLARHLRNNLAEAPADPRWPILTDNRNDIEQRTFRSFYGGL